MATILIVDDEKNIREHLALYVRSLRHRAEVAPDATEALALLERHDPDVIFSDVRMAGMDGLALLREIRRRRPDAVVVLMTAYATVAEAVEAMRAGAYDYLVKPFSLDQVGLLLARVLEVQALRRENRARRHDLPGRGGRPPARAAGQAAPLPRGAPLRARRRKRDDRGRRARRRRHQPRPRGRRARRPLPRGPLLPPERDRHPAAASPRAGSGSAGADRPRA